MTLPNRFTYEGKFPSRNQAENAARTHWAAGYKLKKEYTDSVAWQAKAQNVGSYSKAHLTITFVEPNKRRDYDNVISGLKYLLDGLVVAKVIPDDRPKYIDITIKPIQVDKDNPRVEVVIEEITNETP